ncbi:MAG TPA: YidC/Oxa1 family membrane protein insertase [Solirubrobacteraceae bacterium]|nr:YidC/Oxa1 family membrane protein insertase [Solirubrobacteraceae bacterium]
MMLLAANPLQPLIDFFEAILKVFHGAGLSWGWSIIALTVVVRAALLPLTLKQFKSMQSLAAHQPELKRLQERYKGDRDRLNQEMMKFYKENKINPLASCLPMLAQLPVFISLFYLLREDLRFEICRQTERACGSTAASEFFFIPDLTGRATGGVLATLLILYVGSQLLSSALSSVTADRNQRLLIFALPLFFVPFVYTFPAGLLLYWITTNLWTIVQQTIVRRRLGPLRPVADGEEASKATGVAGLLGLPSKEERERVKREREQVKAGAVAASAGGAGSSSRAPSRPTGPPPAPPRKKKKRSGRRR